LKGTVKGKIDLEFVSRFKEKSQVRGIESLQLQQREAKGLRQIQREIPSKGN